MGTTARVRRAFYGETIPGDVWWILALVDATVHRGGLAPERALFIAPVRAALHHLNRAGMGMYPWGGW